MAYRLKSVRYQKSDKRILLQNENGPCPLLAAANALLLRGTIRLPPTCIRAGAASLDDVCNMLAEEALRMSTEESSGSSFHLNELLTIFPTLQDGMDVNPKFTLGVTGVEYTSNLTAFELLRIELVHGWLLDPQDVNTVDVVGSRTYNELIEVLIQGKEASAQLDTLQKEIEELQSKCQASREAQKPEAVEADPPEMIEDFEVVIAPTEEQMEETTTEAADSVETGRKSESDTAALIILEPSPSSTEEATVPPPSPEQDLEALQKELSEKKELQTTLSEHATTGSLIDNYLQTTSHQLTTYGLMELYKYVKEDALCVFFRNNHFCTLTKHDGVLYLLVTDLGYACVPEIMWEKLDTIDGDTEYMNPSFAKSSLQSDLLPPPSEASPERLLAHQGQNEADFQLALQMAENPRGHQTNANTAASLAEQEGKLMAAATEASLMEYNQGVASNNNAGGTVAALPPTDDGTAPPPPTQEEVDRMVAMNVQAQLDSNQPDAASLALAHQLQREEYQRSGGTARTTNRTNNNRQSSAEKSSCVIS
mmetsp:Transcript_21883/g.36140  ORF Transcript_21883/g.36140 Transcript_21883/m.36140 type:complete len:538 (-) Transcript_21883:69-1682(-)